MKILETDQVVIFRSRVLVIANGGIQGLHPQLFNWFPNLDPEKVFASDDFLRCPGYTRGINLLNKKQ